MFNKQFNRNLNKIILFSRTIYFFSLIVPLPTDNNHVENLASLFFSHNESLIVDKRIFIVNVLMVKSFHNLDRVIDAFIISSFPPFKTTGKICLKSPPNIIVLPPN